MGPYDPSAGVCCFRNRLVLHFEVRKRYNIHENYAEFFNLEPGVGRLHLKKKALSYSEQQQGARRNTLRFNKGAHFNCRWF